MYLYHSRNMFLYIIAEWSFPIVQVLQLYFCPVSDMISVCVIRPLNQTRQTINVLKIILIFFRHLKIYSWKIFKTKDKKFHQSDPKQFLKSHFNPSLSQDFLFWDSTSSKLEANADSTISKIFDTFVESLVFRLKQRNYFTWERTSGTKWKIQGDINVWYD